MTPNAILFSKRQGHFVAQGISGEAVFAALGTDDELPSFFDEKDVADITGLTRHAIKMRRVRGAEPSYTKLSERCVRYPRQSVCDWLRGMYHNRRAA